MWCVIGPYRAVLAAPDATPAPPTKQKGIDRAIKDQQCECTQGRKERGITRTSSRLRRSVCSCSLTFDIALRTSAFLPEVSEESSEGSKVVCETVATAL